MAVQDRMHVIAEARQRQELAIASLIAALEALIAEANHVALDRNALFYAEVDSLSRMLARRLAKLGETVVRGDWSYAHDPDKNTLVRRKATRPRTP